jgi:acyl-CoA thioesterase-2
VTGTGAAPEPTAGAAAADEAHPRDVADLLGLLDLEELDRDLYRGANPSHPFLPHLYGGQVAAQAVRAASLTVPEGRWLHSLHGYFLRRGDTERSTILHVDRDRDGRSFSARHVVARQDGAAIFSMLASFHVDEPGREYQNPTMTVDTVAPWPARSPDDLPEGPLVGHNTMFDLRSLAEGAPGDTFPRMSHRFWARTRGPLPDDRLLHSCVLTYLSDMSTGFAKLPAEGGAGEGPSLDHAVWFHRPARLDDWVLVDLEPIAAAGARGYYTGTVHDRAGVLVATIAQEHLLRGRAQP